MPIRPDFFRPLLTLKQKVPNWMRQAGLDKIRGLESLMITNTFSDATEKLVWSDNMLTSLKTLGIVISGPADAAFWQSLQEFLHHSSSLEKLSIGIRIDKTNQIESLIECLRIINRPNFIYDLELNVRSGRPSDFPRLAASLLKLRYIDSVKVSIEYAENCKEDVSNFILALASNRHAIICQINTNYFEELRLMVTFHTPLVESLVTSMSLLSSFTMSYGENERLLNINKLNELHDESNSSCNVEFITRRSKTRLSNTKEDKTALSHSTMFLLTMLRTLAGSKLNKKYPIPMEIFIKIISHNLEPARFWSSEMFTEISTALLDRRTLGLLRLPRCERISRNELLVYCRRLNAFMDEKDKLVEADSIDLTE